MRTSRTSTDVPIKVSKIGCINNYVTTAHLLNHADLLVYFRGYVNKRSDISPVGYGVVSDAKVSASRGYQGILGRGEFNFNS